MGEARKPGAPLAARSPMDFFTATRPGEGYTLIEKYVHDVTGVIIGVVGICLYNGMLKRPMWAGIHNHVIAAVVGWYCGSTLGKLRMEAYNENEAVIRHYMSLHPEDFPPLDQRYKDVFQKWQRYR